MQPIRAGRLARCSPEPTHRELCLHIAHRIESDARNAWTSLLRQGFVWSSARRPTASLGARRGSAWASNGTDGKDALMPLGVTARPSRWFCDAALP